MQNVNAQLERSYPLKSKILFDASTRYDSEQSGIVFVTTFAPRECGIATYAQDLVGSLNKKFNRSFNIKICALENADQDHAYADDVHFVLHTDKGNEFSALADTFNRRRDISIVLIQHEFGLFSTNEMAFLNFLKRITKPIVIVFHTVLPGPDDDFKEKVQMIAKYAHSLIIMTHGAANILIQDYDLPQEKLIVIEHGTHLLPHQNKVELKQQYKLSQRKVLSTFGLLSSGKSIETTLDALPAIIKKFPEVIFLIIGKTHPSVSKQEGEKYRNQLQHKVVELHLENHVEFINRFLPLPELLEYLQLTDVYLFTSSDPNQAVSGTFSYAMSCGCAVVSTPIPHANEVLKNGAGIIIDFKNSLQLSDSVINLLSNEAVRHQIQLNALNIMVSTSWENSAIAHANVFKNIDPTISRIIYNIPPINLSHVKRMTTDFGMLQFSILNEPDEKSGYTIDDNARALIACCECYKQHPSAECLKLIGVYLRFLKYTVQPNGSCLNYVNFEGEFTPQNYDTNLEDSTGRAVWALGYVVGLGGYLPVTTVSFANEILESVLPDLHHMHSSRAMSFIIKGLYYRQLYFASENDLNLITTFANRLTQMYRHEATENWQWFESYLTYANAVMPEAMLCAWLVTGDLVYKNIALSSFNFLLSKTFTNDSIKVISNRSWLQKNGGQNLISNWGEQPIDVAYTILALSKFADVFKNPSYVLKMEIAFNWFLGNNHLRQIIYNPATGGCYDGLEEHGVNLNQGAESTVSYLMARLSVVTSAKSIAAVPAKAKVIVPYNLKPRAIVGKQLA